MKAAVCYERNQPVRVEDVTLDSPRRDEVRVRLAASAPCANEAEVSVHLPLGLRDARPQEAPRALLGAELAAGIEAHLVAAAHGEGATLVQERERVYQPGAK